ncbi:hypothetical protein CJU89_0752 [Yarrowia sp. B02]|nr:hypothetical protein CJU89_0752 [Yarrowia sp. B02]
MVHKLVYLWAFAALSHALPIDEAVSVTTATSTLEATNSVLRLALDATSVPMNRVNHKAQVGNDAGRMIGESKASLNLAGQLTGKMRDQLSKLEMHLAGAEVQRGFAEAPPQHVWIEGFLDPKDKDELKEMVLESMKEKIRTSRREDAERDEKAHQQVLQELWYGSEDSKRQEEGERIQKNKVQRQWNYDLLKKEQESGLSSLKDRVKKLTDPSYFEENSNVENDITVTLVTPVDAYQQDGVEKTRIKDNRKQYCDLHEHNKVKCVFVEVETKPNPAALPHSPAGGGWQPIHDAALRYLDAIISVMAKADQVPMRGTAPLEALEQIKGDSKYNQEQGHEEWLWMLDNNAYITHPTVDVASWVLDPEVLAEMALPDRQLRHGDGYYDRRARTEAKTKEEGEGDDRKKVLQEDPILVIAADNEGGFDLSSFFLRKSRYTYELLHLWRTYASDMSRDSDLHRYDGRSNARLKNALYTVFKHHQHLRDRVAVVPSRLMASQMYQKSLKDAGIKDQLKGIDKPQETEQMDKVMVPMEISKLNQWSSGDFVATLPRECPDNLNEHCAKYTFFWAAASLANEGNH